MWPVDSLRVLVHLMVPQVDRLLRTQLKARGRRQKPLLCEGREEAAEQHSWLNQGSSPVADDAGNRQSPRNWQLGPAIGRRPKTVYLLKTQ